MLLENPATYVEFAQSSMDESAFITKVVRRTGCGLLLDMNNVTCPVSTTIAISIPRLPGLLCYCF